MVRELLESSPGRSRRAPRAHRPCAMPPASARGGTHSASRSASDGRSMFRRLQILAIAAVVIIAAFSTGLPFLFYLVYLGVLVIGGSYVVTRLGAREPRGRLRGQPAVRPRRRPAEGDLHAPQRRLLPKPWLEVHNPTTLPAGLPGRALRWDRAPSGHGRSKCRSRAAAIPDRAVAHPLRRPVRVLRGHRDRRPGGVTDRLSEGRSAPATGGSPRPCRGQPARPERTLQTTPLATTVRPWAPGDASTGSTGRRPRARATSWSRSSTSSRRPTRGCSSTSTRRCRRGEGDESTVEVAVRAAASIADRALLENRAVGLTASGHRTLVLPARPRQPAAAQDAPDPGRGRG